MKKKEQAALLSKANDVLEQLSTLDISQIDQIFNNHTEESIKMLRRMSSVMSLLCGNSNKVGEVITALTIKKDPVYEDCEVKHVRDAYGADIQIKRADGSVMMVEDKTSMTKSANGFKANWNFSVNMSSVKHYKENDKLTPSVEQAFISSAGRTMKNGCVTINAYHDKNTVQPNRYILDGNFMALFLSLKAWISAADGVSKHAINLNCKKCAKCGEYHRIKHLEIYNAKFLTWREENAKTPLKWDIFTEEERNDMINGQYECHTCK